MNKPKYKIGDKVVILTGEYCAQYCVPGIVSHIRVLSCIDTHPPSHHYSYDVVVTVYEDDMLVDSASE